MRKLYKGLALGVPSVALSMSAVAYMVIASRSTPADISSQIPGVVETPSVDKNELHSTLYTKDLYDDLEIHNGNAIITDNMIGKILSKLVNEAHFINYEGVYYNYEQVNDTEVFFTISWPEDGVNHQRNYLVNITKDI